jgi:hypothetical protein
MPRVFAICGVVLLCGVCDSAAERTQVPSLMNFTSPAARFWVQHAVDGAAKRLENAECQRLFDDFRDAAGNRLAEKLRTGGVTPAQYLTSWVWFVDGSDQPGCGARYRRNAFTQPGNRVIFICGQRLVNATAAMASADRDIAIIHEMLHTMGLGENPPTSAQITKQVAARCLR